MMSSQQFRATADGERGLALHRDGDFQATLLGMAGHDLRQPLQVIQSAYEWLGSRVMTMPERNRLERGERAIAKLTEQLDRLVGALRLYEHTKSITLSPTALAPLFDGIASDNREAAIEKGVELRISPTTASVMSHPVLLDGILRNLVRNAIKYTEPGGRILLGCRRFGTELRIDIYDTGIGIAPEHLSKIFDAFVRLDSTHPDGLGIGLFVVRRAVRLLGHHIEVKSAPSRGSRFSVLARASHHASQ